MVAIVDALITIGQVVGTLAHPLISISQRTDNINKVKEAVRTISGINTLGVKPTFDWEALGLTYGPAIALEGIKQGLVYIRALIRSVIPKVK